jgi:nitrogenase molybdenum-iron protein beta chain
MPVGIATTDAFIQSLTRLSGKRVQKVILDERGRLVDAMTDTFHHTMMKRVAIFGDPDTVLGLTGFVCEIPAL